MLAEILHRADRRYECALNVIFGKPNLLALLVLGYDGFLGVLLDDFAAGDTLGSAKNLAIHRGGQT